MKYLFKISNFIIIIKIMIGFFKQPIKMRLFFLIYLFFLSTKILAQDFNLTTTHFDPLGIFGVNLKKVFITQTKDDSIHRKNINKKDDIFINIFWNLPNDSLLNGKYCILVKVNKITSSFLWLTLSSNIKKTLYTPWEKIKFKNSRIWLTDSSLHNLEAGKYYIDLTLYYVRPDQALVDSNISCVSHSSPNFIIIE